MIGMIALVALGVAILSFVLAVAAAAKTRSDGVPATFLIVGALALLFALIFGIMRVMPEYNLWKASVEKRILVEQALAERDSATHLAEAEVRRAEGVARSNEIIAESITNDYLRWLFIQALHTLDGQVIYLPTEAGLPILEAGRLTPQGPARADD